jgi:hypothetical protein
VIESTSLMKAPANMPGLSMAIVGTIINGA